MVTAKQLANLRPATPETARARGRLGGLQRAKTMERRRTLKEALEIILDSEVSNKDLVEAIKATVPDIVAKLDGKVTNGLVVAMALIHKASTGNIRAMEVIRDTVDGKPARRVEYYYPSSPSPNIIDGTLYITLDGEDVE